MRPLTKLTWTLVSFKRQIKLVNCQLLDTNVAYHIKELGHCQKTVRFHTAPFKFNFVTFEFASSTIMYNNFNYMFLLSVTKFQLKQINAYTFLLFSSIPFTLSIAIFAISSFSK